MAEQKDGKDLILLLKLRDLHSSLALLTSGLFFSPTLCGLQEFSSPPGIEPRPLAMKAWNPNHWTSREFPGLLLLEKILCCCAFQFRQLPD